MQWFGRRESSNVEDKRSMSGGGIAAGGGVLGVVVTIIYMLLGGDPAQLPQGQQLQTPGHSIQRPGSPSEDSLSKFIAVVLADNEDVWNKIFNENGMQYEEPKLVLFRDATHSGCGGASSQMGPFYCPADHKVYLDLVFLDELKTRFGAPGDFAAAYVVAHEVGHHVQNLLGTFDKVEGMKRGHDERYAKRLSVAVELQADFYAGVWARHNDDMKHVLDRGDIEEALGAANSVGDDRLQKESQGYVVPDAFTHGTSAQRMYWFKRGYESGDIRQGNTFKEVL